MSATSSTATTGRSIHIAPIVAIGALTAVLAVGALGIIASRPATTTDRPAAGAVVTIETTTGPRSATQKGLGVEAPYVGSDFAGKYRQWLAAQAAAANASSPDYFQRMNAGLSSGVTTPYVGSDFAGQYRQWLAAQKAAAAVFPDYFQRLDKVAGNAANGGLSHQFLQPQ